MRKRKREREKGEQESKRVEREESTRMWRRRRTKNGKEREGIREGSSRSWRTCKTNRSGFVGRVINKLEINKAKKSKLPFLDSRTRLRGEKLLVRKRLLTLRERSSSEEGGRRLLTLRERRVSKKARGVKEKNRPEYGEEGERRTKRRERESKRDHREARGQVRGIDWGL